jgi:hypothetical protein
LLFYGSKVTFAQQVVATDPKCFAFLLNGDVWINCSGQRQQITKFDDVEDFAIDIHGQVLDVIRYQKKSRPPARSVIEGSVTYLEMHDSQQIFNLRERNLPSAIPLTYPTRLVSSCGTVLSVTWDDSISEGSSLGYLRNDLTMQRVQFEPYRNFRCSSDRKTVIGWVDPQHTVLKSGLPPNRDLVDPHQKDALEYDISPNGRYIAFSTGEKICVSEDGAQPNCTQFRASNFRLSVSDWGEVLYVEGSGEGCYYTKDSLHASTKPRPGYTEMDECVVLLGWRPADSAPKRLELHGSNPQWITPEVAALLHDWTFRRSIKN